MSFIQNIRPNHIPPFLTDKDDLQLQREIILQHVLNTTLLFALVAFGYYFYLLKFQTNQPVLLSAGAFLLLFLFLTVNRRLSFNFRAFFVLGLIGAVGVGNLLSIGLPGNGLLYLVTFGVITGTFFGARRGIAALIVVFLIEIAVGWLMINQNIILPTFMAMVGSGVFSKWISSTFSLVYCATMLAGGVFQFTESLGATLKEARLLARNLDQEKAQLESRVQQRTNELTRKASQLDTARQIAAKIAAQTDIQSLLSTSVDLIRERFGFYHAGIFLPDENNEFAVLRAATGQAGRSMLEANHRLKIGQTGIVGHVMSTGEPRITGNVDEDPAHYVNPLLPETHSEMAVPMKLGEQVIGVLDVQSTRRNAFSADDVDVLMTIADQLSTALDKARLLAQYQDSVDELRQSAQQNTRSAWRQHLHNSRKRYAYRYRQMRVEPIPADQTDNDQILWENQALGAQTDDQSSTIQAPITLRGQTIGLVKLKLSTNRVTSEMSELIENAVDRMALSLETVRLVEEIQVRSERERMVGEIATKVRAATDIETILRTTASELGKSLGVSDVLVQLAPADDYRDNLEGG